METINKKLYYALLSTEGITLKGLAVLRQEIDIFVLKHGVQELIDSLNERYYCFTRDSQWRVCAEKGKEDDYILLL